MENFDKAVIAYQSNNSRENALIVGRMFTILVNNIVNASKLDDSPETVRKCILSCFEASKYFNGTNAFLYFSRTVFNKLELIGRDKDMEEKYGQFVFVKV